ncbi:hypothetical protein EVAR_86497_1 [Eumeta japonica]|uniref:Uncharacterized protein n=1 Tax=Eumeta variegata TaxID=151549 RepID=A0A4C1VNV7_EUMVA|nr:hypothetical protein EVAR_86497_1 [Eumeta japonica]
MRAILAHMVGGYSEIVLVAKLRVIQTCLLPALVYDIVQLLPRISKSHIVTLERQDKQASKVSGEFPKSFKTETSSEMLDEAPYRIHDLHSDMLKKLTECSFRDLENPGIQYQRHGLFNPMVATCRCGEIEYLQREEK